MLTGLRLCRLSWRSRLAAALCLLVSVMLGGCFLYPKSIVVYTFDGYFDPSVVRSFELETGTLVHVETYKNNAELVSRLKVSWGEFDVVVPSDHELDYLINRQLIVPLNKKKIPNYRNISPVFTPPNFQKELDYAVPYFWMTLGIGYRAGEGTPPNNWKDFFSSDAMSAYSGRISLINEVQETMGLAAIADGFHPNTTDEHELNVISARLMAYKKLHPHLSSTSVEGLISGTASVALCWTPAAVGASLDDPRIKVIVPTTDTISIVDTMAIPASSRKKDKAEQFINFMLRPDIAARLTNYSKYPTTVTHSLALVDPVLRNNPAYVMPAQKSFYVLRGITEKRYLYDATWAEFTKGLIIDD